MLPFTNERDIMTGLPSNVKNMEFIGLCLEGFFYGLYSAIFTMCLQYQTSGKGPAKTRTTTIIFYSLCLLYVLLAAVVVMDMAIFQLGLYDRSTESMTQAPPHPIPVLSLMSVIAIGFCDFIAQSILIYRCWIVWDCNIRVVIVPSILAFLFLVGWPAAGVSSYTTTNADWAHPIVLTCLTATLTVNALVTGLIVFRIIKVYWGVKSTSTLGSTRGNKLRTVIFVIIESGMSLFVIQVVQLMVSAFWTATAIEAEQSIKYIQQMLIGITPTIIQVRVSMGLSFHDGFFPSINSEPESIGIVGHEERDDIVERRAKRSKTSIFSYITALCKKVGSANQHKILP